MDEKINVKEMIEKRIFELQKAISKIRFSLMRIKGNVEAERELERRIEFTQNTLEINRNCLKQESV